jgi:hypothetical protein
MNISLNSPQGGASSDARNGADRPRQQQHQGEERKKFQQLSEILAVVKGKIRLTPDSQDINRRYDYRYSVLPIVFAHLIRDGRLSEDALKGLRPEKLELIKRGASL